ncbi:hypothetical protein [Alkalicoccobacillus porphyridii]|uniref:hypothetical protein n=1 Tax=Alkalicoccobacillus porphyridii TaxID=2597270 RepID=UPI00163DD254|nr:hypothetical protein [Alkalicoccobacillus porphyridii]
MQTDDLQYAKARLEQFRQEARQHALASVIKRKPFYLKKKIGKYVFSIKQCEPAS